MNNSFGRSSALVCTLVLFSSLSISSTSARQAPSAPQMSAPASAQSPKVETRGQKSRGNTADDANVTTPRGANDSAKRMTAPTAKGGPQTRGGLECAVHIDNRTPWIIELYMEGGYWADIPRYGDVEVYSPDGRARLYARARFVDGSTTTWGPQYFDCGGQPMTWTLTSESER